MRPFVVDTAHTEIRTPPQVVVDVFAARRSIVCNDSLGPTLLEIVRRECRTATFVSDTLKDIGSREIEAPQRVGWMLSLLLSRRTLRDWIAAATGCGPLSRMEGRVVRTQANGADGLGWHSDTYGDRKLGFTLHLSEAPYEGGSFEMRLKSERTLLCTMGWRPVGTALIFDVSEELDHRVVPLSAGGPRQVFTGWFF